MGELERFMTDKYLRFSDQDNPLQFIIIWTVRGRIACCPLVEFYSSYSMPAAHPIEVQCDAASG